MSNFLRDLSRFAPNGLKRQLKKAMRLRYPMDDLCKVCELLNIQSLFDIGAHYGESAQRILEVLPNAKIDCFEPTPDSFGRLVDSFGKSSNVSAHQIALSDSNGKAIFNLSQNEQTNSLLDSEQQLPEMVVSAMSPLGQIEVETVRLDDWVDRNPRLGPIAAKVDVQGAELMLLKGGEKVFREKVEFVLCEASLAPVYQGQSTLWSLNSTFASLGFELYFIYPCIAEKSGQAVWTDAAWIKPHSLKSLRGKIQ